jgi:hypothetical protein
LLVGAAELGGTELGESAAGAEVLDGITKLGSEELDALGWDEQAPSASESPRTTAKVLRRTC